MNIMAVDPGRDKCGLALLSPAGEILWRRVVPTDALAEMAGGLLKEMGAGKLVLGNGTTHAQAERRLREALPDLVIVVVDEYRTTEMARKLYWQVNPPRGWRSFLPTTLQMPPEPVDDLVAVILARRALGIGLSKGES
jgi:RNase H-fold protein (predicted Holliday junction resolvase)